MNNSFSFDQMPSFSMFCMLQDLDIRESALIDVCSPVDETCFKEMFHHVGLLQNSEFFQYSNNYARKKFDLIAFQDMHQVTGKIFNKPYNRKLLFSFFTQIHEKLKQNGLFIYGYSNMYHIIKNRVFINRNGRCRHDTGMSISDQTYNYHRALNVAGFSDIKSFYSIPSHQNIMHVCQDDEITKSYYMKYMYPESGGRCKSIIVSLLQKFCLLPIILPSCLIVARA